MGLQGYTRFRGPACKGAGFQSALNDPHVFPNQERREVAPMSNVTFASVWDAIEDTADEAENMKLRSALMMALDMLAQRPKPR